jgi:hypothetical protein
MRGEGKEAFVMTMAMVEPLERRFAKVIHLEE